MADERANVRRKAERWYLCGVDMRSVTSKLFASPNEEISRLASSTLGGFAGDLSTPALLSINQQPAIFGVAPNN